MTGVQTCALPIFPAILVWAPAHVLPGVLAVSAFHEYFGVPHHGHPIKHMWILTVCAVAIVVGVTVWIYRRRQNGGVAAVKPPA